MNKEIFYSIYSFAHQSIFLDNLIVFIAGNFGYLIILFAMIFLLFHHDVIRAKDPMDVFLRKWKEISLVFFAGIFAWVLATILKMFINTPRPFLKFSDVQPLFFHGGMDSFPSGHATFFSALAISLFFSHKKIGILFMVFTLLIGLARVASGVHFPVDILAGFVIGSLVAFLVKTL